MILINIKDLIPIMSDLINLFLSGFVFMYTYSWFNNRKIDISILTIWSLFISILIKSFYSALHIFILPNIKIHDAIKIIIFFITGILLAIICTYIKQTKLFSKLLYKINNKSINDDIFDDIIDYDKRTMMNVFLKSSDIYYVGRFSFREENGINSWISLVEYCSIDKTTNERIFDPEIGGLYSSVAINLKDIERIEIFYEKDSDVWEKLIGRKPNNLQNNQEINND